MLASDVPGVEVAERFYGYCPIASHLWMKPERITDRPTLYVDFSGDLQLRDKVHQHFGESLVYRCFAGSA